ncbi:MAG: hypothetical protein ACU836_06210 [Gammaproteobacteria bacterium]
MKLNYFLISVFALSVTSCTSDCRVPPNDVSQAPSPDIQRCSELTILDEGKTCAISVSAKYSHTDTGLYAERGEEYEIEMPENQVWYDCTIRVPSLCGKEGTPMMNLASFLKKETDSNWFSVIAEITSDNNTTYDLCKLSEHPNKLAKIAISNSGTFLLYPNDAYGFYGNNSGSVWFIIHRTK